MQIKLFDLSAKFLLHKQAKEVEISLSLLDLNSGFYLLELSHEEGLATKKVMIK
ncbi:MAG: T9SS type A sorting domain-containing protein [Bacteroidales bacterium]